MASFEGMRPGPGRLARDWRVPKYAPLYVAGIVAGVGLGLGLTVSWQGSDSNQPAAAAFQPIVAPANVVVPPDLSVRLAEIELPLTFTSALPTAFEDEMPLPAPEPVAVPVLETAPAAPVVPAAPPVASKPVVAPAPAPAPAPPPPAEKPDFYIPDVPAGGVTNLEQRLLDGINAQRASAGLAPYAFDAGLARLARIRSQQMADQGYFGHVDPYGYSMYTELLQKFGYRYAWAGENLALNNYNVSESPERAIISLMKSPTHAANILGSAFSRIGIGEVTTADGRHIYAMIFLG